MIGKLLEITQRDLFRPTNGNLCLEFEENDGKIERKNLQFILQLFFPKNLYYCAA